MKNHKLTVVLVVTSGACTPMPPSQDVVTSYDVVVTDMGLSSEAGAPLDGGLQFDDARAGADSPSTSHDVPILRCPIWPNVDRIMQGQVNVSQCSQATGSPTEPEIARYTQCILTAFNEQRPFIAAALGSTTHYIGDPPRTDADGVVPPLLLRRTPTRLPATTRREPSARSIAPHPLAGRLAVAGANHRHFTCHRGRERRSLGA